MGETKYLDWEGLKHYNNKVKDKYALKDGYYGSMTVGTAENLVGRGSVEAEYTGVRTSAGTADIGSGSATIVKMMGNSVKWNHLVVNGNFVNEDGFLKIHVLFNVENNECTIARDSENHVCGIRSSSVVADNTHKYLIGITAKRMDDITADIKLSFGFHSGVAEGGNTIVYVSEKTWTNVKKIVTPKKDTDTFFIKIGVTGSPQGISYKIKNVICIDLTAIFGEGNEPATVEEFEAWLAKNVGLRDYYPYNPGEIINNGATGITTYGFNLYDYATGKAYLPGKYSDYPQEYEICGTFESISFTDINGNTYVPELTDGKFFNVSAPGELTVVGGNNTDTLVHLVWSGWRNEGEPDYAYESFWKNTLPLNLKTRTGKLNGEGESVVVFPNGLAKIGDVQDEIKGNVAIKRIGVVDLGTLDWNKQSSSSGLFMVVRASMKYKGNLLVIKDWTVSKRGAVNSDKKIGVTNSAAIPILRIQDSTYDGLTGVEFKTAMLGILLYYELATPETYILDEELPSNYRIDDFGTEQADPAYTDEINAAIRYDVQYAMNAVDPIRRLPQNYVSATQTQNFSDAQKAQARQNIGAMPAMVVDDEPTNGSDNLVKSGGVQNELALGTIYDVSAKNPTAGTNNDGKFASLGALLSDANLSTLIPTANRKGGMSIKFVQSSDNKYVQFRYMSSSTAVADFTNVANWQGVDDEPTEGSDNLVKSGGVAGAIENAKLCVGDELEKTYELGLLKWDGTIDTTTLPTEQFAKIEIPNGSLKIFIKLSAYLNINYCNFWILDADENIIFKERAGSRVNYNYRELFIPQNAKYIYITRGGDENTGVYSTKGLYPTIKNLEINSEQAQQDITNLIEQTDSIEKSLFESVKIDESSSISGYLKTNGTISATNIGKIFKFDIVEGVTKYYVTLFSERTPNAGWSQYWLVDNNGIMLAQKPVTIPSPQNYNGDLEIDISTVAGVTQIWLSANPSYPHYLTYTLQNIIDVNKLKSDIEQAQQDIEDIQEQISSVGENRNQWKGKKIIWMGTSIPAGQGISGENYPTQIAELLSCTVQNNAVPGLALEGVLNEGVWTPKSSGSASLTLAEYAAAGVTSPGNKCYENNMLGKNADLYVFDCEPNNSNADTTILNNFNVNTWAYTGELSGTTLADHRDCYIGCLIYLLDKLWTEKPDAKVVFVGEHTSCTDFSQNYAMSEASAALAQKLRIPYIDLAEKLYYNKFNVSVYVNGDKVHPTQAGHDRIAKILANELLLIA